MRSLPHSRSQSSMKTPPFQSILPAIHVCLRIAHTLISMAKNTCRRWLSMSKVPVATFNPHPPKSFRSQHTLPSPQNNCSHVVGTPVLRRLRRPTMCEKRGPGNHRPDPKQGGSGWAWHPRMRRHSRREYSREMWHWLRGVDQESGSKSPGESIVCIDKGHLVVQSFLVVEPFAKVGERVHCRLETIPHDIA